MKITSSLIVSLFLSVFFTAAVSAQTPINSERIIAPRDVQTVSNDVRSRIQQRIENARQERDEAKELIRNEIEEARQRVAEEREEFRENLEKIRDERKRAIVERIDEKIQSLNERWVENANGILTRLTLILEKAEARVARIEEEGAERTGAVNTAISQAKDAIASAQRLVNAQAEKTYVIEVTDEASLGESVRTTIQALKTDIRNMMSGVQDARSEVQEVIRELAQIVGTNE